MTPLTQATDLLRADGPDHDQFVRGVFASAGVEVCQGEAYDAATLDRVELTREERELLNSFRERR